MLILIINEQCNKPEITEKNYIVMGTRAYLYTALLSKMNPNYIGTLCYTALLSKMNPNYIGTYCVIQRYAVS